MTRMFALAGGALLVPAIGLAQPDPSLLSVPAPFVRRVALPGEGNDFLRPDAVFVDRTFGEVLVADTGHARIVILDEQGTLKFEFGGDDRFASPSDVVVDSQGRIYVVGSTRSGRVIHVFDFDGVLLSTWSAETPEGAVTDIGSIALDSSDNVYLLDPAGIRVCSWDAAGSWRHSFALVPELSPKERREAVFGSIEVSGDLVYVPVSSLGTVIVHDAAGVAVQRIGHKGNDVGELNFPVDVAVKGELVMVLDKLRYNVVCFAASGRFLGEFGGKGSSPGWFYHPTILEADDQGQVYVGQIFQNKIQVCRVPEFIVNGLQAEVLGPSVSGI
jgi:DNA-binding beta-propeller fold protein YncE